MTFQPPPPPPPPGPPPQGPQGGWGPPGGQPQRPAFDPKNVNQLDWGILAAGVLAFIFSFVSYYTFSYAGVSVSENAWHGFFGWFAMLLALIGSGLVAASIFAPQVKMPIPPRLAGLGCYAVATLCVILAIFIVPGYLGYSVPDGVDKGHGFGFWISLIVIIAGLVLSLMRFQQTGGQLPGALANIPNIPNIGGRAGGQAGGQHGGQVGGHQSGYQSGYQGGHQGGYQGGYQGAPPPQGPPPGYAPPPAPPQQGPPPQGPPPGYAPPPAPPQQGQPPQGPPPGYGPPQG